MPASSLIFVVIIAVWAAFLLQHWIRRRDHVATAKSVDRFSEAMRVLERRQSLARMDLSRPAPRSYSVSPLRPAHPDVVVKRADAGEQPRAEAGPAAPAAQPRWARALRGATLLLAVAVTAAAVGLGLSPLLHWWVAAAAPALLLLTVAVLRGTARPSARRARSAAPRPAPRQAPVREEPRHVDRPAEQRVRRVVREAEPAPTPRARPVRPARRADAAQVPPYARPVAERRGPVAPAAEAGPQLYDVEEAERASAREAAEAATAASAEPPAPGTWQPVAVPTPTYLMKAPARRPVHGTPYRTPVDELPFDGHALALEEEFEELPAVHG